MSATQDPIVIVSMARTPMGGFQGDLAPLTAPDLGATALSAALERSGLAPEEIDEVLMGCVLPAGIGQAPARQAALKAGLDRATGCTTVNKVCGSGMKTVMMGHDFIKAGSADIVLAGGMESMSNAPYLMTKARAGFRMGHGDVKDHMFLDGLEDGYEFGDKGRLMGGFAEDTAQHYQFSREDQDNYAIRSLERALKATKDGAFKGEITDVKVSSKKGDLKFVADEQPFKARPDKIPTLKPAFAKDGTVTAANSSSISDGGAALMMMRQSEAAKRGLTPLARILGHANHAQEPKWFTTAPVGAMNKLLDQVGWTAADVDLYEINEAFAVVVMAAMRELDLPADKVNIHGGACALGHPIGCSGTRIIVTLLGALAHHKLEKGVATLCIGGGEATAIAVERLS